MRWNPEARQRIGRAPEEGLLDDQRTPEPIRLIATLVGILEKWVMVNRRKDHLARRSASRMPQPQFQVLRNPRR